MRLFVFSFCFIVALVAGGSEIPAKTENVLLDKDSITQQVAGFYKAYESSINTLDYDESLRIINTFVAEDFKHYDDGVFTYDKAGFLERLKEGKNNQPQKNSIRVDILDVYFVENSSTEVRLNFRLAELGRGEDNKKILECHDSIRVLGPSDFKLYKCDCITK